MLIKINHYTTVAVIKILSAFDYHAFFVDRLFGIV